MSEASQTATGGGVSAVGLLGVAFVVLKLCHVIGWSWWWVLAPFWGGLVLFLVLLGVAVLVALAVSYKEDRDARRRLHQLR